MIYCILSSYTHPPIVTPTTAPFVVVSHAGKTQSFLKNTGEQK